MGNAYKAPSENHLRAIWVARESSWKVYDRTTRPRARALFRAQADKDFCRKWREGEDVKCPGWWSGRLQRQRSRRHNGVSSINKLDRGVSYFFVARQRAISRSTARILFTIPPRGKDLLRNWFPARPIGLIFTFETRARRCIPRRSSARICLARDSAKLTPLRAPRGLHQVERSLSFSTRENRSCSFELTCFVRQFFTEGVLWHRER